MPPTTNTLVYKKLKSSGISCLMYICLVLKLFMNIEYIYGICVNNFIID